jgi:galactoside O-acetyltransferase
MNIIADANSWRKPRTSSKLDRIKEVLITTLLEKVPAIALGVQLRQGVYPLIFAAFGSSVYIETDVKFYGTSGIEIGDGVKISSGVRINTLGHENNKVSIGSRVFLERGVDIGTLEDSYIEIGEGTYIGLYTCIAGYGNIKIGKNCLIAAHTGIYGNSHTFADPNLTIAAQGVTKKGVVIGDDCWLGHGVTVVDGVTIGQGSVIGAGAVVNRDIPPYSIAVGVPARVISKRNQT